MKITAGTYSLASLRPPQSAAPRPAPGADRLIAANTATPVAFAESAPSRANAPESFALYTRAAEKNAVATAVVVGRTLDLQA